MTESDDFIGAEPPFLLFEIHFHSLFHVVESHKGEVGDGPLQYPANPAAEMALIGLVAHVEAFCKHQFAALVNANRKRLSRFAQHRPQATMSLVDASVVFDGRVTNLGAVIAEQYDFGSATKINGLFRDLVGATPFSKDESRHFDQILSERHLLVHHAGIHTQSWLKKGSDLAKTVATKVFRDRLMICTEGYHAKGDFLFEMAMKVAKATVRAAREIESEYSTKNGDEEQYRLMLQGLYDSLE